MDLIAIAKAKNAKRWVYGSRTDKWYLVDKTDRDHAQGIAQETFKEIGKVKAKEMYLQDLAF